MSDSHPYSVPAVSVDLRVWPPALHTSEAGSFAYNTFKHRIPPIIDDIVASNAFAPDTLAAMRSLRDEITAGTVQPLGPAQPDAGFWNTASRDHLGRTWLDVPWYWAEAYFYRRILECTRYFQLEHPWHGVDPYANKKLAELAPNAAPAATNAILAGLPTGDQNKCFKLLCYASLWGNRTDLSYNVALTIAPAASLEDERDHLLVDHTQPVWDFLTHRPTPAQHLAMITDNSGTELLMDLTLVGFLLDHNLAERVTLQLKGQPYYISDAMPRDVLDSLAALAANGPHAQRLSAGLRAHLGSGRLELRTHWFYTSCLMYYQLPDDLRRELASYDLVLLKGDANYRRLLGDAHWEPTASFEQALSYFPAPLLALRTLKAELIAGLDPGVAERLSAVDPHWRTNGQRGVVQARLPAR